jgi:Shugoshin N-terminal coiled-coil region
MRQNRDIARANSTQSLRIRALENEVAKLLSDNLDLRSHILRLQNELENGKAQKAAAHAQLIKSQLENKMKEISELLGELGQTPATQPKVKTTRASSSPSPAQKNWENMCSLGEAMAGQEGRLPPILEDKQYPRKTLEYVVSFPFTISTFCFL